MSFDLTHIIEELPAKKFFQFPIPKANYFLSFFKPPSPIEKINNLLQLFLAPHYIYISTFREDFTFLSPSSDPRTPYGFFATLGWSLGFGKKTTDSIELENLDMDFTTSYVEDVSFFKKYELIQNNRENFGEQVQELLDLYRDHFDDTKLHVIENTIFTTEDFQNRSTVQAIVASSSRNMIAFSFSVPTKIPYFILVVVKKEQNQVLFVDYLNTGKQNQLHDFIIQKLNGILGSSLEKITIPTKREDVEFAGLQKNELGNQKKQWCLLHLGLFLVYNDSTKDEIENIYSKVNQRPIFNILLFSLSMFLKTISEIGLTNYLQSTIKLDPSVLENDRKTRRLITEALNTFNCYNFKSMNCPDACVKSFGSKCAFKAAVTNSKQLNGYEIFTKMYEEQKLLGQIRLTPNFERELVYLKKNKKFKNSLDFMGFYDINTTQEMNQYIFGRMSTERKKDEGKSEYEEQLDIVHPNPLTITEHIPSQEQLRRDFSTFGTASKLLPWSLREQRLKNLYQPHIQDTKIPEEKQLEAEKKPTIQLKSMSRHERNVLHAKNDAKNWQQTLNYWYQVIALLKKNVAINDIVNDIIHNSEAYGVRDSSSVKTFASKCKETSFHIDDAKFRNFVENYEKKIKEWVKIRDLYEVVFDEFKKQLPLKQIRQNVLQTYPPVYTPFTPHTDVPTIFKYFTDNNIREDHEFSIFLEKEKNKFMTNNKPLFPSSVRSSVVLSDDRSESSKKTSNTLVESESSKRPRDNIEDSSRQPDSKRQKTLSSAQGNSYK